MKVKTTPLVAGIIVNTYGTQELHEESRTIRVGQIYKHYKGNLYKVVAIAVDTEAGVIHDHANITNAHRRVVYYALDNKDLLWVRPYEMFAEKVTVDGVEQPRFAEYDMPSNDAVII